MHSILHDEFQSCSLWCCILISIISLVHCDSLLHDEDYYDTVLCAIISSASLVHYDTMLCAVIRSASLAHVNGMLREQLDQATEANQQLTTDIHRLTQDWQRAREELEAKETEWREEEKVCFSVMSGHLHTWIWIVFLWYRVSELFVNLSLVTWSCRKQITSLWFTFLLCVGKPLNCSACIRLLFEASFVQEIVDHFVRFRRDVDYRQ